MTAASYDAVLLLAFGGPEKPEDVMPFLENVVRGKGVPRSRLEEVAEHYAHFGGKSPINDQSRELVKALTQLLGEQGPQLPVYWGNRNWHPLLADTLRAMQKDGVRRAAAFVPSAFGSHSGCRQYLDDIARARAEVGPGAPEVDKLRLYYNHPGFVRAVAERMVAAIGEFPPQTQRSVRIVFTAHSIPVSMADTSPYEQQLRESARLAAESSGFEEWELCWQSRSGPPQVPWLEPDILDHLRSLDEAGVRDVLLVPIGFGSDHMEVVYDLDYEARALANELGMNLVRAGTVGTHPTFIHMIRELILERVQPETERRCLGLLGPAPDACATGCCPAPRRRPAP